MPKFILLKSKFYINFSSLFKWTTNEGNEDLGFIAEEVSGVDPILATYDPTGHEQGVKYRRMTAVLTKAVQDLHEIVEAQGEEIDQLKAMVNELIEKYEE